LDWEEIKFSDRSQRKWCDPHRTTPTRHIFKAQVGILPNGIDQKERRLGMADIVNQGQRYGCRRSEVFLNVGA
jgi:hypothetical protein